MESVLIIDDNEIDNFVSKRVIENSDFSHNVRIITSGEEALSFFESHFDDLKNIPNMVFLDLNMPVVDGFMFLFEFDDFPQTIKDKCKIVILSGALEQKTIDKILKNDHVLDYISKPLTEESLKRINHKN